MPSTTSTRPARAEEVADIATLGDSNTGSGYWRKPFQQALRDVGCRYDMIGGISANWWGIDFRGFDRQTDAVGGAVIATFRNPSNAIFEHGAATLASNRADLVIVIGGTNDLRFLDLGRSHHRLVFEQTISAAEQHLREAAERSPGSRFLVVSIPHLRGRQAIIDQYNTRLREMVDDLDEEISVGFANVPTGPADLGSDGVHLTVAGGARYGAGIAAAAIGDLRALGSCG